MSARESSAGEGALASLVVLAFVLLIVALLIGLWLTVKFLELVVRQLVAHPRCKPLWAAVIGWCVLSSAAVVTFGAEAWLNALAVLSTLVLLVTAKVVELYYAELAEETLTKERVVTQVLHEPWWQLDAA